MSTLIQQTAHNTNQMQTRKDHDVCMNRRHSDRIILSYSAGKSFYRGDTMRYMGISLVSTLGQLRLAVTPCLVTKAIELCSPRILLWCIRTCRINIQVVPLPPLDSPRDSFLLTLLLLWLVTTLGSMLTKRAFTLTVNRGE